MLSEQKTRKQAFAFRRFNVAAGSGGVAGGSAASSVSDIALDTYATIGSNAKVAVIGDIFNPGRTDFSAVNSIAASDKVKLDAGGVIAIAGSESRIRVNQSNAEVRMQGGATLDSVGTVNLGARTSADLYASANTKTYGAASAAQGTSEAAINTSNRVTIGSSAQIMAEGDVNLYAGMDALGIPGVLCTVARTDLFNQTPFAIETNPTAEAKVTQNNLITTAAGSSIKSVGHISLLTTKGTVIADGIGIGKDLSLQFAEDVAKAFGAGDISLEIRTGTSRRNSLTGVVVDGDVHSGIRNKQRLVIGYNSSDKSIQILEQTDGIAYETSTENIVANMFTRLRELEDLVAQYDPDSTVAQACRIEINYIKEELLSLGYAEKRIVGGEEEIYPIRYVEAPFITVHDTVARSGKVTVSADYLAGSGSLRAPRDAEISIINQSPWFLRVQRLTVDADGGFVYFNNRPVTSSSDINDMNVAGSPIANLTLDSGGSGRLQSSRY